MNLNQIQEIIKNFEKSKMTFLELEVKNFKLKLSKNKFDPSINLLEESTKNEEKKATVTSNEFEVKSPLVGTFYATNSSKCGPFVKVNQKVEKGQTLCIIEAMKIMNEIIAPVSGTIASIKVNNGDPVGFDQVIMTIV